MRRRAGQYVLLGLLALTLFDADYAVWTIPLALVVAAATQAGTADRLLVSSVPGVATVLSAETAGPDEVPMVWTLLRVEVDGWASYDTEHVTVGSPASAPEVGERFWVRVDPGRRDRVAHAHPGPRTAQPVPRLGFPRFLRSLGEARRDGRLTDEEFAERVDAALASRGVG